MWCYWKPNHQTICTWRAFDIWVLLLFLEDELPVLLEDVPLCIRQDGTPPHFGSEVTALLNQHFQNHCIRWQGLIASPLRSTDLTPSDHYLRGCMNPSCRQWSSALWLNSWIFHTHKIWQTHSYEVCYFINISISNYFIKCHYYLHKCYNVS